MLLFFLVKKELSKMATSLINTECKRYGCMKNLLACYANCRYNSRCDDLRSEILPKLEQATNDINTYRRERELTSIEIQMTRRGLKFIDVASLQKNLAKSRSMKAAKKKRVKRVATARQAVIEKDKPDSPKERIKAVTRVEKPLAIAKKRIEPVVEKSAVIIKKKQEVSQQKPRSVVKKRLKIRRKKTQLKSETQFKMSKKPKDSETENSNLASGAGQPNASAATEKTAASRRKKSAGQDASAKKKKRMFIILDGERSALVDEKGLMAKLLAGVSPNARYFEATEIELRLQIAHKK